MWRMAIAVMLFVAGMQAVYGEDHAGVLNDPPATVNLVKEIVNKLNPSYETVWTISDGTFSQGVSASLYTFTDEEIPIASLRLGFATNEHLYGGASLDLPGITRRYLPATIKGMATVGPLDTLWSWVGKYARVGIIGGYAWATNKPTYGLTAGAALSF